MTWKPFRNLITGITPRLEGDTRAASFNLSYTITVAITTILLLGVISGVGTVLDAQQDRAVSHQSEVIGEQISSGVMAVDRMGGVGDRTNATLTTDLPSEVVGTPYHIELREVNEEPHVIVETSNGSASSAIPVEIAADIEQSRLTGGGKIEIVHETRDGSNNVITIHEKDDGI